MSALRDVLRVTISNEDATVISDFGVVSMPNFHDDESPEKFAAGIEAAIEKIYDVTHWPVPAEDRKEIE